VNFKSSWSSSIIVSEESSPKWEVVITGWSPFPRRGPTPKRQQHHACRTPYSHAAAKPQLDHYRLLTWARTAVVESCGCVVSSIPVRRSTAAIQNKFQTDGLVGMGDGTIVHHRCQNGRTSTWVELAARSPAIEFEPTDQASPCLLKRNFRYLATVSSTTNAPLCFAAYKLEPPLAYSSTSKHMQKSLNPHKWHTKCRQVLQHSLLT